jgi:hypothetical protein
LALAKAVVHLRHREYAAFLTEFSKAGQHPNKRSEQLVEVLVFAASICNADARMPLGDLKAILSKMKSALPAQETQLRDAYCQLVSKRVRGSLAGLTNAADFQDLFADCKAAKETGKADTFVSACLAECILRREDSNFQQHPTQTQVEDAKNALGKIEATDAAAPYRSFVGGLIAQAEYEWKRAAESYKVAFKDGPPWMPWQNEGRRTLAGWALYKAGNDVKANARLALEYYVLAKSVHPQPPSELELTLAESAYRAEDYAVCDKATTALLKENHMPLPGEKVYQLLLWNADSREKLGNRDKALESYHNLVKRQEHNSLGKLDPVMFCQKVLEPAILLAKKALDEKKEYRPLQAQLARFYAAKGKLILDNPYKDWMFSRKAKQEAVEVLNAAIDHHPDKQDRVMAEYHARRGFAVLAVSPSVSPLDLQTIRGDWETALSLNDKEFWGWALKGHYFLIQAWKASRFSPESLKLAHQSIAAYEEAIKKAQGVPEVDRFLSFCHETCSIVYVYLANNRRGDNKDKDITDDLEKAKNHAERATKLNPESKRAWVALGNALEDLAWKTLGNQPQYYPEAIKAFKKVKEIPPVDLDADVAMARCAIKWAEDVQKEEKLAEARKKLREVLQTEENHVEGNYWLGHLLWKEGNKAAAREAFAKAIADPTEGWKWLDSVGDTIGPTLEAWQPLFKVVLPANRSDYREKHVPALYKRCVLRSRSAALLEADLAKANPQVLADADVVARLSKDPTIKANAHAIAAVARIQAANTYPEVERVYRRRAIDDLRQLLESNPDYPDAWQWMRTLANQLELCAAYRETKKPDRRTLYTEAIKQLDLAIQKATTDKDKESLRSYQRELEKKRGDLDD